MTAGTIFLVLLTLLGLVLLALAALNTPAKHVGLLAAGLFCWMLAWAILAVLPKLTG
jgi:hypothetical protein